MSKTPIQMLLESQELRTILKVEQDHNITKLYVGLKGWSDTDVVTRGYRHNAYIGEDINESVVNLLLWALENALTDGEAKDNS